ncbi:class I SAM-dependent methyltransferase [Legionella micdadei]|uniref:O-methyltransferase mdmC n=1 Tax=Legionella micdadei TaxID=451 RepID=A0A098GG50_LEGMI|nr:class I SAM-dependent methyltransferase [Legionella micdadei]ARG97118.1 SAM-dependent methyltransferase [Legionella micdadei]ARH00624.1 SAM-dependent methyltransferase [Legionella micdadei]KTD29287.1 SAM-dependent O-methyltransferase [Legionella micdadei]NSL17340.1 class I SAM-dependent methyltransferase [Legionella micdadei]CEG61443.1 O-methyltransferase mdmC [Legionella micdadei]
MKHLSLTPALYDYMLDISLREHPVLKALRDETAKLPLANMQVAPEQAQFMQFLIRLIDAKKILELGTFTGYSALAMALALPDDGELITCDINTEWTSIAPPFWREAQQEHKISLRLAPALDTLHHLLEEGYNRSFDFIFIDADKTNYVNYYELALQLISPRGIIAIDNVFWDGKVIDEHETGGQTREIRRLNALIKTDERVEVSLLAIADGLFLVKPRL